MPYLVYRVVLIILLDKDPNQASYIRKTNMFRVSESTSFKNDVKRFEEGGFGEKGDNVTIHQKVLVINVKVSIFLDKEGM